MDFNKWEHFVNDDSTRSFLSLEVTRTGLPEVCGSVCLFTWCLYASYDCQFAFVYFGPMANSF